MLKATLSILHTRLTWSLWHPVRHVPFLALLDTWRLSFLRLTELGNRRNRAHPRATETCGNLRQVGSRRTCYLQKKHLQSCWWCLHFSLTQTKSQSRKIIQKKEIVLEGVKFNTATQALPPVQSPPSSLWDLPPCHSAKFQPKNMLRWLMTMQEVKSNLPFRGRWSLWCCQLESRLTYSRRSLGEGTSQRHILREHSSAIWVFTKSYLLTFKMQKNFWDQKLQ